VESATGEDESWPARAVDMVKKMKEIKRGDIIGFSPALAAMGHAGKNSQQDPGSSAALERAFARYLNRLRLGPAIKYFSYSVFDDVAL
jgi:hypothetical protein